MDVVAIVAAVVVVVVVVDVVGVVEVVIPRPWSGRCRRDALVVVVVNGWRWKVDGTGVAEVGR